jgi:hypothetical protein
VSTTISTVVALAYSTVCIATKGSPSYGGCFTPMNIKPGAPGVARDGRQ